MGCYSLGVALADGEDMDTAPGREGTARLLCPSRHPHMLALSLSRNITMSSIHPSCHLDQHSLTTVGGGG